MEVYAIILSLVNVMTPIQGLRTEHAPTQVILFLLTNSLLKLQLGALVGLLFLYSS